MSPIDAPYRQLPVWYWLVERVWRVERALAEAKARRTDQDTPIRIFFVLVVFSAAFATLAVGASTKALWNKDARSGFVAPAVERADLTDRNGNILAVDLTHYGVYVDPREVWDIGETRRALAAALPNIPSVRLERVLRSKRRAFLAGDLTPQEKQAVHDLGLPGVSFQEEDHRVYPLGASAAHLIGFVDKGGQGLSGAELGLDDLIQDEGKKGDAVALSIDTRVQAALEDELQKASAYYRTVGALGMVVDVQTGEILAMSSYPDFDPNQAGRSPPNAMTNRAVNSVFELGSVFKAFTIAMGLDSGTVNMQTQFDVHAPLMIGGHLIHDFDKGDSVLPLWEVFTHSSNIGAAKLALLATPERTEQYFERFGLMAAAPTELPGSARPILPRKVDTTSVTYMSFGQGISVSPLALATGYTSLMNGGEYIPLTIRKMEPGDRPKGRRVISEQTSALMRQLMRLNVTDPKGSGKKADAPGLRVGGKTGSAQKPENGRYGKNNVSSFVALFPTDGPPSTHRYLVLITLDSPHTTPESGHFITAGWNAAPTAGRVIDRIAPFLGVKRQPVLQADASQMGPKAELMGDAE